MVGYNEFLFGSGDHSFLDGAVVEVWVGVAEVDIDSCCSQEAFVYPDVFQEGFGQGAEGAVHITPYLAAYVEQVYIGACLEEGDCFEGVCDNGEVLFPAFYDQVDQFQSCCGGVQQYGIVVFYVMIGALGYHLFFCGTAD